MEELTLKDRMLIESGLAPIKKKRSNDNNDSPAVAVLIIKDGKILCATRKDNGEICGPGGHVEVGETVEQAVVREAVEEFSITPLNLIPLGKYEASSDLYLNSMVYFTDEFAGTPKADGREMLNEQWLSIEELRKQTLFLPFEASLDMMMDLFSEKVSL